MPKTIVLLFVFAISIFLEIGRAEPPAVEIWPGDLPTGSVTFDDTKIAELKAKNTKERIAYVDRAH